MKIEASVGSAEFTAGNQQMLALEVLPKHGYKAITCDEHYNPERDCNKRNVIGIPITTDRVFNVS